MLVITEKKINILCPRLLQENIHLLIYFLAIGYFCVDCLIRYLKMGSRTGFTNDI